TAPGIAASALAAAPTADTSAPESLTDGDQGYGTDGAAAPANGVPHSDGGQAGNGSLLSNGVSHSNGVASGNGDAPGAIVPPATSVGEENRLPIFESVESHWFRRRRLGSDSPPPAPAPGPS